MNKIILAAGMFALFGIKTLQSDFNAAKGDIRAADSNSVGLRESGFRDVEQNLNVKFRNPFQWIN